MSIDGMKPLFAAEAPVGAEGDRLFEATTIRPQLDRIAAHIIRASRSQKPSLSMTFLISGKWGTGKSSALRCIHDRIVAECGSDVIFAEYPAPLYDTTPSNARASLMYVLTKAAEDYAHDHASELEINPNSLRASGLLVSALGHLVNWSIPENSKDAPTETDLAQLSEVQNRVMLTLALQHSTNAGVILEQWLAEYLSGRVGPGRGERRSPTVVVLVDDLDRCSTAFATQVLGATNFWAQLPNHFFLLAAQEDRLKSALGEHMDRDALAPDRGLRKYVHFTVELWPNLQGAAAGQVLFGYLLDNIESSPKIDAELRRQLDLVTERPAGEWAVLEPLANPSCSRHPNEYTPRLLKERFNSVISALEATYGGLDSISSSNLKQQVIELNWPIEWQGRLSPAQLGNAADAAWCRQYLKLGEEARGAARSLQRGLIEQGAQDSGLDLSGADPLLAVYLASDPPYVLLPEIVDPHALSSARDAPASDVPDLDVPQTRHLANAGNPLAAQASDIPDIVSLTLEAADEAESDERATSDLRTALDELLLVADLGDDSRTRELLSGFYGLMQVAELDPGLAPRLGNLALALESMDLTQDAARLHLFALRADPSHANVNQNFVDFLVDHPIKELQSQAEAALSRLETDPQMREWRPLRTRVLQVAFNEKNGVPPTVKELEDIVEAVTTPEANIGKGELISLLFSIRRADDPKLLTLVCGELCNRERDEPTAMAATIRLLADGLARRDAAEDENFGGTLYRHLLLSGLALRLGDSEAAQTLNNFSILLNSRRAPLRAWYLLWHAYRLAPQQDAVRFRLARVYKDRDDPGSSERLVRGAVDAMDLPAPPGPPFTEPLPPPSPQAQEWIREHVPAFQGDPLVPEFFEESASPQRDVTPS